MPAKNGIQPVYQPIFIILTVYNYTRKFTPEKIRMVVVRELAKVYMNYLEFRGSLSHFNLYEFNDGCRLKSQNHCVESD